MKEKDILIWDRLWPAFKLKGTGTKEFLNGKTTLNILKLDEEIISKSCLLDRNGKLKAILEFKLYNDYALIIVISGDFKEIYNLFESVIFPADNVQISLEKKIRRLETLYLGGMFHGQDILWLEDNECIPSFDFNFKFADFYQVEEWRIKGGIYLSDDELKMASNPYELGLSEYISMNKGCYLGQESMARIIKSGFTRQQLRYWEYKGKISGNKILNHPTDKSDDVLGSITYSVYFPESDFSMGYALVKKKALNQKELLICDFGRTIKIYTPFAFKQIKSA